MKRIITLFATITSLVIGLHVNATFAGDNTQVDIQGNLWKGANIMFDGESQNKTKAPDNQTSQPTNNTDNQQSLRTQGAYTALGDSVAAGLGLGNTTDQCGRSNQAYPHRIANSLSYQLIHIACSGATAGDLFTKQEDIAPQLDTAFTSGTPTLITITAGANDVRWAEFAYRCYYRTCGTAVDTYATNTLLIALQLKLTYAFNEIQKRSNNNPPTVIITGYYNPLSNQCIRQLDEITQDEVRWLNSQRNALNQTIRNTAANYPFIHYVPLNFSDHGLCSNNPWVQGLNDAAPLHPNSRGQAAIARTILNGL